ncbi:CRISPR-associated endonuclease Cas2 [Macellibacteroides fermentans]|uniref:CRISPR-associated endonuclease Cas2 n=1 Tax=Macellibacteroides fermentans TaxID=879969 RepID=UPI00406C9982
MINRVMRLIVMFDLPVSSRKARKEYTLFRKFLIKDGYSMLQYSVYTRITRNHDDAKVHLLKLNGNLPRNGSVRVLQVTEKQYSTMFILVGSRTASESLLIPEEMIEL